MTVEELIERLQKFPPSMEVVFEGNPDAFIGPIFSRVKDAEQMYLLDHGETFVTVDPDFREGVHCVALTDY